jgi:hypothetical protein
MTASMDGQCLLTLAEPDITCCQLLVRLLYKEVTAPLGSIITLNHHYLL